MYACSPKWKGDWITREEFHFELYRRIADVCLFLAGVFPEYVEAQHRYPLSRQLRPRAKGRICNSLEDYEAHGQAFYRLAAEHEQARVERLNDVWQPCRRALSWPRNHWPSWPTGISGSPDTICSSCKKA